jgi:hypothetical protein
MATALAPFGFRPVRTLSGAPWSGAVRHVLMSGAANCFVGDAVMLVTDGAAAGTKVAGQDVTGMMLGTTTTATTTGATTIGVIVGFLPDPSDLSKNYRVASTNRIALVSVGRDTVYEIQEDAVGANLAAGDIGLCTAIVVTAGSTTTGRSKHTIDSSATAAVTATLPVRLIGLARRPGMTYGTSSSDGAIYEVLLNSSVYGVMAAGV